MVQTGKGMPRWTIVLCVCAMSATPAAAQRKVYWTDPLADIIQRGNLDGSNVEVLISNPLHEPNGLAVDPARGKLYWADSSRNKIQRSNLDGSNLEDVIAFGLQRPSGVALDAVAGKLYWTEVAFSTARIARCDLDGSNIEILVTTDLNYEPLGIALDTLHGKMYWADGRIRRANLDGSMVESLVATPGGDGGAITIDAPAGKIYWTDRNVSAVYRANLDGSAVERVIYGSATGVAIDAGAGKMYWCVDNDAFDPIGSIRRADLDGSNAEVLIPSSRSGVFRPQFMVLDATAGWMYWTDRATHRVQRARTDGSELKDVVTSAVVAPLGIAVDPVAGKLYWADTHRTGGIWSADLNGERIEQVITNLSSAHGVAVDPLSRLLFWTDSGLSRYDEIPGKVQRANLDGSQIQDLSEGDLPLGIAADPDTQIIYWGLSTQSTASILSAQLDGSMMAELSPAFGDAGSVAVDPLSDWVYWTTPTEVYRARRDGSAVNRIIDFGGNSFGNGVAADSLEQKIYIAHWISFSFPAGSILRANSDGSQLELVVGNLLFPYGITVDPRLAGDFDASGDVDLKDYSRFQACFTGDGDLAPGCSFFDADPADRHIDLNDFALFLSAFVEE